MPRIRSIKPEFWNDSKMALTCSRDARLLFISLWNFADDRGRAKAHPAVVKAQAFPFDDVTRADVEGWLGELERGGFIRRYEAAGESFLDIRTFKKHQKIDTPSRFNYHPEPPRDLWSLPESPPSTPRVPPEGSSPDQEIGSGWDLDQEKDLPASPPAAPVGSDPPPAPAAPPPLKLEAQPGPSESAPRKPSWQQELWQAMQQELVGRPGVHFVDPGPPVAQLNTQLKRAADLHGREAILPAWQRWCEEPRNAELDPPFAVSVFLKADVLSRYVSKAKRSQPDTS